MTIACGETAGNSSGSDVSPPWCGIEQDLLGLALGVAREQHRIVSVVQEEYDRVVVRIGMRAVPTAIRGQHVEGEVADRDRVACARGPDRYPLGVDLFVQPGLELGVVRATRFEEDSDREPREHLEARRCDR